MVALYWLLVVANGTAVATIVAGWWALPLVGIVAAWFAPARARPLLTVPLGSVVGWGALLARSARAEGFGRLLAALEGAAQAPAPLLIGATLGLAAVLGFGASLVGTPLRRSTRPGSSS